MPPAVHAVAAADMNAQLDHAIAHRLAVAEVARLHLAQTNPDTRLRHFVAQRLQPCRDRLASGGVLIPEKLRQRKDCSLKATNVQSKAGPPLLLRGFYYTVFYYSHMDLKGVGSSQQWDGVAHLEHEPAPPKAGDPA
jgi:hypothetical protein